MSRTKDAMYDEDRGAYVDAMRNEERAMELWLRYPGSPRYINYLTDADPGDENQEKPQKPEPK